VSRYQGLINYVMGRTERTFVAEFGGVGGGAGDGEAGSGEECFYGGFHCAWGGWSRVLLSGVRA